MKKVSLRTLGVFLASILLLLQIPAPHVRAQEDEPTVIRVAFPQVEGFSTTDENGERHGLVVDYLDEIAKYTGWEYEYIDTPGDTMLDGVTNGEFDLAGGVYRLADMDQRYGYPDYSCGNSKSVLLARWDDETIRGYDLTDLNGKTIGVYNAAQENIRRLKEYLSLNGVSCAVREYPKEELSVDGKLYHLLENKEVDLLLGNAGDNNGRFRAVAYFDAQPHYLITRLDAPELLEQLNWALEHILGADPNFAEECYKANFSNEYTHIISLNREEQDYISEKGVVTVALPSSYHPFYCVDREDGEHSGMVPDVLKRIAEFSGLTFSYVFTDSYTEARELVQQGGADMLGFYLDRESQADQKNFVCANPYAVLNDLIVRNKAVTYPAEGLTCALIEGRTLPPNVQAERVVHFDTPYEALAAVDQGRADFVCGLSSRLESELQRHTFSNCVPISLAENRNDVCFGLGKPADPNLLTILNKAINSLTEAEREALVNRNLVSAGQIPLSLKSIIAANPVLAFSVITVILALIVLAVILLAHARIRSANMRIELDRAESNSRAKSEFLSRMSHEIRTPMNAIVGITDLLGMQQEVPAEIRKNLSKLSASSHYLLSLINDILDMSRIDSGMMKIVSEPFSLTQMLQELRSMMKAEAERRELSLQFLTEVRHPGLTGDALRLKQVLTNLLSNAIKFTPAGGHIKLLARETDSDDQGATFFFQVSDTGIGIGPEDQTRIFDAFEQAGESTVRIQGTGLGLPISSNIIYLMGGQLKLKSKVGQGSDFFFTLTLPYGSPEPEPDSTVLEPSDLLAGASFLLAEDNEINAEIVVELLQLQGARVTVATDGGRAVELFAASAPGEFQAILMDIQMPVMNGLEATGKIRGLSRPDAASIPIIAMTANSFQEDKDAAKAAGMDDFVTKPLDVGHLYSMLRALLDGEGEREL